MYILQVIPFSKSFRKGSLSYFSTKEIPIGSIVTIDLRNKNIKGLVINKKNANDIKGEIKKSAFGLKKIKGVTQNTIFRKELIKTADNLSKYFATDTGPILESITPAKILEEISKLSKPQKTKSEEKKQSGEKYIIQDQDDERYLHYKSLIREEFAKKKTILFICPTIEDVIQSEGMLNKGIESNTFILHSKLTVNQMIKTWNKILEHEKPVLIISTGIFLGIPRHDVGSIVIEKESARSYKTLKRPYIDIRKCAEEYSKQISARFFLGDLMLRSETLWRYDKHEFYEYAAVKFRSISDAKCQIIDMKENRNNSGDVFSILSNELKNTLKNTKENNENTFLFVARKGLSPSIVCSDCGTIVVCNKCSSPMVLYGKDATIKENYFQCHLCGDKRSAGEKCQKCNGWRLKTLGIGSEMVLRELNKEFPNTKIFILDSDNAKTPKHARIIIDNFYNSPGSILIGTEMALLYLRKNIENTGIVSIDSLFSIPDFSIREKILNILLKVRSKANQNFIVQTRKIEDKIFEYAKHGNLSDFYRDEFKDRKQFNYPPFSLLIKFSLMGTKAGLEKEFEKLKKEFENYDLLIFPAFNEKIRGKFVRNGLIKLDRQKWVDDELTEKIKTLPLQFKVVIDADNLL